MVAKKKSSVKSKATKVRANPARVARRATPERGLIDCIKLETHGSELCISSHCRERCRVEIRISCGPRLSFSRCYWDGRQWVCDGDQGHISDNE